MAVERDSRDLWGVLQALGILLHLTLISFLPADLQLHWDGPD